MHLSIGEKADVWKYVCLSGMISLNYLRAWFVDLNENEFFLDDVIEACFENFF